MITKTLAPGFEIKIPDSDITILRKLGERVAAIAALPAQEQHKQRWRDVNGLRKGSIAVLVRSSETPWNELTGIGGLALECTEPFSRTIEDQLRKTIFQWEHMPCDMIVEPIIYSPMVVMDSGFGVTVDENLISQGENPQVSSHHFTPQIQNEKDVEKIQDPQIVHNAEMTQKLYEIRKEIFDGILKVQINGFHFCYFSLWDELVTLWGPQELMMDLVMRPELVHLAIDRYTNAWKSRLDQYQELNMLSFVEGNYDVGSGGLAHTDDLPGPGFDPNRVTFKNHWGFSTAQIFGMVSPDMHEEFALRYERRLLSRFGLTYYGCCEPLHDKIHILRSIPNLRKVSISPWANLEKSVERIGLDYALSIKPNPAIFVSAWNPATIRKSIEDIVEKTRGCAIEIIMKDISTVSNQPEHLFEWAKIAMEVVKKHR